MTATLTPVAEPGSVMAGGKWTNVSTSDHYGLCTKKNAINFRRDKDNGIGGIH
jgi:hypothetical protein